MRSGSYGERRMEGLICCNFGCSGGYAPHVPEPFRHRIRVRFNECDGQGVVFYANYLMYFDVAMTELWREALGGGYAGMIAGGTDAMVAEANIRYRASARFDDELDLLATVTRIGTTSTVTHITAERVTDGSVLAEADLRHVFIEVGTLVKSEIPGEVRTGMERYAE
jgi:acyl-CoA thioester hydrolase